MPPSTSSKSSLVWSVKFYLKMNNILFKFNWSFLISLGDLFNHIARETPLPMMDTYRCVRIFAQGQRGQYLRCLSLLNSILLLKKGLGLNLELATQLALRIQLSLLPTAGLAMGIQLFLLPIAGLAMGIQLPLLPTTEVIDTYLCSFIWG